MTDFADDELASAYLDEEATSDERARVESDPALLARVEELRATRDRLRAETIVLPSTNARDDAIRRALAGADVGRGGKGNVVDLRVERARRRLRAVSIAAGLVVVLGVLGALIALTGGKSDTKASTAAGAGATTTLAPARLADESANATAGAAAFADNGASLGSFSSRTDLVDAIQAAVATFDNAGRDAATAPKAAEQGAPTPTSCPAPTPPPDAIGPPFTASAVLDGRVVEITAYTVGDGSHVIYVTDATSCVPEFSQSG